MPSRTVAIATCAEHPGPDDENRLLLEALEARGIDVAAVPWTSPGGWEGFDAVVVRMTWDYTSRLDEFRRWTRAVAARLHNGAAAIGWNADKRYLFDLRRDGIPVVAGEHLPPGAAFIAPTEGRYVVKPTASAGARDTAVYDGAREDAAREHVAALHAAGRDVLVQPYLGSVETEAESAVVFIDGRLSHCMRKGPLLALDQPLVEGLYRPEDMRRRDGAEDVLELARRTHAVATNRFGPLLYARVDVLRDDDGTPTVLELELIEPSLFLDHAPGAAEALAAAVERRVG
ncbi:MAG TPA: hypothetical protein VMY78_06765 [Solirubrobacteraceae bacterium]|nr:hypothetical protein [Solirubrobacteraceae bacterium]